MTPSDTLIAELNIMIAPLVALILVAVDYRQNDAVDPAQRRNLTSISGFAVLAILAEIVSSMSVGKPGPAAYDIAYSACFLFFSFQFLAFAFIPLFVDYHLNRDATRLGKLRKILGAIFCANLAALVLNIGRGFYFQIDPGNNYMRGDWHVIRVAADYSIFAIALVDCWLCRKKVGPRQLAIILFSILPPTLFGAVDLLVPGSRLLWPAFSLSFLSTYLFVVKADYAIDALTGVYSRREGDKFLADMVKGAKRHPYLLVMIDIDEFKSINDRFGHHEGDNALKDTADIIKRCVRRHDFVARLGGDEFFIAAANCDNPQAFVDRIKRGVEDFNATHGRPYALSLSIGHGVYQANAAESPADFLKKVDFMMYQNKNERRRA